MPTIDADDLTRYAERIFVGTGSPPADATTVATHLVEANLKGHDSHGVIRIENYVRDVRKGAVHPGVVTEVESETDTTAVLNGHWNYGQVVGRDTMAAAIDKARAHGVGIVTAHGCAHAGRLGTYGEQATRAGMIAIVCSNQHGVVGAVAPFGGVAHRLSTNPIVVAVPSADPEAPFVLDIATTMSAEGKVRVARNRGEKLPLGWIIDAEGNPSTDPWDLYGGNPPGSRPRGSLLPMGGPVGHKGFGLSMAVELLGGALSPAGLARPGPTGGGNGLFMLAFDPGRFGDAAAIGEGVSGLVERVKQPPFAPGVDEIFTAGDIERRRMQERLRDGITIDDETWRQIQDAATAVGVDPADAPSPR